MKNKFLTDTRVTGLLYLGLALAGGFAFMFANAQLYVAGDPSATTLNLIQQEPLARLGIAVELLMVTFQALAAVWFFKLFRKLDTFSAGLIAVFGTVNAVTTLIATALWLSALNLALANGTSALAHNTFGMHETIWSVSGIFFGLWLVPMGILASKAKMPKTLAAFLIAGGVGYVISTFISILLPGQKVITNLLTIPATVGELWMIGYLLVKPRLNVEE